MHHVISDSAVSAIMCVSYVIHPVFILIDFNLQLIKAPDSAQRAVAIDRTLRFKSSNPRKTLRP